MKELIKSLPRIACFTLIFLTLFWLANRILRPNSEFDTIKDFYNSGENTLDVVFFGSSRVFCGISPMVMWRQEGIASFDLAKGSQPLWNTYYYMKECLKYQRPTVMVLDVYMAFIEGKYTDSGNITINTVGMKFSQNKIDSILVSSPKDTQLDYLLGFPAYHARYKSIGKNDFVPIFSSVRVTTNGYYGNVRRIPIKFNDVSQETERKPISPKSQEYLLKIIDLAKENGVPLLFVVIPNESPDQKLLNTIADIANENDIEMINYNMLDVGLDYNADFLDKWHLNYWGAEKLTSHLASYLAENYDVPNRKDDPAYAAWDKWADDAEEYLLSR